MKYVFASVITNSCRRSPSVTCYPIMNSSSEVSEEWLIDICGVWLCSNIIHLDDVLTDVSLSDHCPELTKLDHQDPHINNILVHWCKQDSRSMLEVGGGTATLAPGELYWAHLYSYWVDTTGSEAVTLPWRWNLLEMLFFVIKRCYSLLSRVW